MMVASGPDRMIRAAKHYYESAGEPKQFWELDDIPFGSGILEKAADYDFKLLGFFNKNL